MFIFCLWNSYLTLFSSRSSCGLSVARSGGKWRVCWRGSLAWEAVLQSGCTFNYAFREDGGVWNNLEAALFFKEGLPLGGCAFWARSPACPESLIVEMRWFCLRFSLYLVTFNKIVSCFTLKKKKKKTVIYAHGKNLKRYKRNTNENSGTRCSCVRSQHHWSSSGVQAGHSGDSCPPPCSVVDPEGLLEMSFVILFLFRFLALSHGFADLCRLSKPIFVVCITNAFSCLSFAFWLYETFLTLRSFFF